MLAGCFEATNRVIRMLLLPSLLVCLAAPVAAWAADAGKDDRARVVDASNAFAIDLYNQLRNQSGNLFFSPESISTALAMTYAGARGQTAAEMANTLHFTLPPDRLHPAMGALLRDLNAAHTGYQLRVANALWAQQGYTFRDDFLKLTESDYGAAATPVDFANAPESACQTINRWVEQKTDDKIKDLIAPNAIHRETKLVLTNAIYFKGDWLTQFDKAQTKDEDFHVSAAHAIKAPLMNRDGHFNYFDGSTFQVLEIPYKGNELSMIVLLPKEAGGMAGLEQSMTPAQVKQWLIELQPVQKVILTLPRFKMTQQFRLADTLRNMGMVQAFDARADFTGMTEKRELFLSAVIHKAFVDVNEEGTEAAAATAVIATRAMATMRPVPPIVFRADHPFVFLIRDNRSGAILFMGRVTNPTS